MPDYLAVKLKDLDEGQWVGVPKLWLAREDDNDGDDDDDYDFCWWPNNDVDYKARNEIIFNGSTKGWESRDVEDVDSFHYASLEQADTRADVLNRLDLEDERYNQLDNKLDEIKRRIDIMSYDRHQTRQDISEMKEILITLKNNALISRPTLEALLPIKSPEDLETFETRFLDEEWISPALKELIGILTDNERITESVSKILEAIFSRELARQCSWDEENRLKIKDLSIIKKINVTLKNIDPDYDEFQEAVTSWLESKRE